MELTTLAGALLLLVIASAGVNAAEKSAATGNDAPFNAGRHFGIVNWAQSNCSGRMDRTFGAAMEGMYKVKTPDQFANGTAQGQQEMQRAAAKDGKEYACLAVIYLYGPRGRTIPNAWIPSD